MSSSTTSTRSTSSSLSSTFSDLSAADSMFSAPSSPPPSSKTHAFFASSFAASPPPPRPLLSSKKGSSAETPSANDNKDAASTPSLFSSTKGPRFNVARIFPSRYARSRRDSSEQLDVQNVFSSNALRRKPEFLFIDVDPDSRDLDHITHPRDHAFNDVFLPLPTPAPYHDRSGSESSMSPPSSICSSTSHVEIGLPSPPPPPPLLTASSTSSSSDNEFTPRPANLEPSLFTVTEQFKNSLGESIPLDTELREGDVITDITRPSASPSLRLTKPLGQGAFSAVWLADDLSTVPLTLASKKSVRDLKRQASLQSKGTLSRNGSGRSANVSRNSSLKKLRARLRGMQPSVDAHLLDANDGESRRENWVDQEGRLLLPSSKPTSPLPPIVPLPETDSSSISRNNSLSKHGSISDDRVVAVKLTPRRPGPTSSLTEERTRVGFVREVEVLRHISHPNITPLLAYFSTPANHVLVLPYLKGGDLLSLVNNDDIWGRLSESVLRRMWCEICRGVGWMHSVGIVHRDIKLENVLLTWEGLGAFEDALSSTDDASISSTPTSSHIVTRRPQVSDLPTPLIKLTDFGLSRFIDIGNGERGQGEMLSTRCGSEAYAAPELVMGGSPRGVYDARETDAWACGVVLYALVGRRLPFGEGVGGHGNASRIGGERAHAFGYTSRKHAVERRAWLMKIARGEYEWPEAPSEDGISANDDSDELVGPRLPLSEGARRVAGRLLVRDPKKRARIVDLWDDEWMRADAIGEAMWENLHLDDSETSAGKAASLVESGELTANDISINFHHVESPELLEERDWEPLAEQGNEEGADDLEEEDEGWLLDEESIASIARQEVVYE